MVETPYKIRVRRVRANVLIEMMVPVGRSGFKVVESIDQGPVTFRDALKSLGEADLTKAPRLKAALIPEIT